MTQQGTQLKEVVLRLHNGPEEVLQFETGQGITFRDLMVQATILNGTAYNLTTVGPDGKKIHLQPDWLADDYIHKPRQEILATPRDDVAS